MLEQLKRTLVDSLIGSVALGYLLAVDILSFVNVFVSPAEALITRSELPGLMGRTQASAGFPFRDALPQLASFLLLSLVWYLLFHWLYLKPFKKENSEPVPGQE